jgi:hypothetical protein
MFNDFDIQMQVEELTEDFFFYKEDDDEYEELF